MISQKMSSGITFARRLDFIMLKSWHHNGIFLADKTSYILNVLYASMHHFVKFPIFRGQLVADTHFNISLKRNLLFHKFFLRLNAILFGQSSEKRFVIKQILNKHVFHHYEKSLCKWKH